MIKEKIVELTVPIGQQLSFFEDIPGDIIKTKKILKRELIIHKEDIALSFPKDITPYKKLYRRNKKLYED